MVSGARCSGTAGWDCICCCCSCSISGWGVSGCCGGSIGIAKEPALGTGASAKDSEGAMSVELGSVIIQLKIAGVGSIVPELSMALT